MQQQQDDDQTDDICYLENNAELNNPLTHKLAA